MSRLGCKPIPVPAGVELVMKGRTLSVKGPKGTLVREIPAVFNLRLEPKQVLLELRAGEDGRSALHGLNHRLIANMVEGVSQGYVKALEIQGVGFKAAVQGRKAVFSLGYSAPVELDIPEDIHLAVADGVNLTVSGPDKQRVGDFAARIRSFYPAEPYKGKGIRYKGEYIKRKVGKTVA